MTALLFRLRTRARWHCRALSLERGRDRGDADPVLVLVSLAVLALVTLGITIAVINAQQWGSTHALDSVEQTSEDGARLAWMGDVGTSTQVVPAAKVGTTALTSVRFDNVNREAAWPGGAQCRAVTWWLEDTVLDPKSPNALDPATGDAMPAVAVHREVTYFAGETVTGGCVTSAAPVARGVSQTPVKNAVPGARFTYVNGHLRDLVYPASGANRGMEACQGVAKGATGPLTTCVAKSAAKRDAAGQRTLWEWADPTPVQVMLEMTTDQAGMGEGYGTQIGWRELAGRRELTGNAASPVTDTLGNPPAPAAPASAPLTSAVMPSGDPAADYVTVRRTDPRDLDGFEYRCLELLNGAGQRWLPGEGTGNTRTGTLPSLTTAVTVADTRAGYQYACSQRGWVNAVTPKAIAGQPFTEGVSPWSPAAATVTRRPLAPTLAITPAVMADGRQDAAVVTWPAVTGATYYWLYYQLNDGPWLNASVPGTSWTSPPLAEDTRLRVTVQAVNDGGASNQAAWVTSQNPTDAPAPSIALAGGANAAITWPGVAGAGTYRLQFSVDGGGWGTERATGATSFIYTILGQGQSLAAQVRSEGSYTDPSVFVATGIVVRPVDAPTGVGIIAQSPGTGSGTATATAIGYCSDGMQAQYWWSDDRGNVRDWSTDNNAAAYMYEGDTNAFYYAVRCANTTTGVVSPQVGTQTAPLYRPHTAPGAASMWDSGNGYTGSNITFSWSSSGAGYYRVYNSGNTLRYEGGGTSLTVRREAGATCARVAAYRSVAHYYAGAAAWSGTACGDTAALAPSIPAGCITTNEGSMSAGSRFASASLCQSLRDRYQMDTSDPDHIRGAWTASAYDAANGIWLNPSPASSGPFSGQAATVTAWVQVNVPPVTRVRFVVTLHNGAGSVSQTVTVNVG